MRSSINPTFAANLMAVFSLYSNTCCCFGDCSAASNPVYYKCNKNTSVGLMKGGFSNEKE
jgi:hypothetical protein